MRLCNPFITTLLICIFISINNAQTSFNISNKTTGDTLLTIDNDGNVGIGITTPAVKFDLRSLGANDHGRLWLSNSDLSHFLRLFSGREGAPNPAIIWNETDAFRLGTSLNTFTEYMRIASNGNLGLGITDPTAKLDIQMTGNGAWQRGLRVLNPDMVTDDGLLLVLGRTDESRNMSYMNFKYSGDDSESNRVSFGLYGVNDVLNILGSGNVGIGTIAPSDMLEVAGTIHSTSGGFRFPDGTVQATAAAAGGGANTLDQAYDEGGAGAGRVITADNGAVWISGNDGLIIDTNLGIGITSPSFPLDIEPANNTRGINIDHNYNGSITTRSIYVELERSGSGDATISGAELQVTNNDGAGPTYGVQSSVTGSSTGLKFALRGMATGEGSKYGLYGIASGTGNKYGVFGSALGEGTNWAGYFASGNVHITNMLGIANTNPTAMLDVSGSALFEGTYGSGTIPKEGAGARMMWYPTKAAFRVGRIQADLQQDAWDDDNIGSYSIAMGVSSIASGNGSFAVGVSPVASGESSIAIGISTVASGDNSTALGTYTHAESYRSTAVGSHNIGGGDPDTWLATDPIFEIGIGLDAQHAENAVTVLKNGNVNIGTRIITPVLEITGGSDLSEQFNIRSTAQKIRPGMVVCINSDNPGELQVSTESYDRRVAGIISGAGGIQTGMLMGQKNSVANGEHPVALSGRVYCLADASNGPINPGDLLTTSDKPGHAMKVSDYDKAQGAILGKAMSSLEEGCKFVLVLVTLQ